MTYRRVYPASNKSSFTENDNIEFRLDFPNSSIRRGSVTLSGVLTVTNIGASTSYDTMTGAYSFFESVVTEFNGNVVENLINSPRRVKMLMTATQDDNFLIGQATNCAALRLARDKQCPAFLAGERDSNALPFTISVDSCVNRCDAHIPYRKTGQVRINLRVAPTVDVFTNAGVGMTWTLTNMEMNYEVVDESRSGAITADVYHYVKHQIASGQSSIQTRVPAVCDAVSISFITSANEHKDSHNNLVMDEPKDVKSVQFTLNNNLSMVQFPMTEREEILFNYKLALGRSAYSNITLDKLNRSVGYGIGLAYGVPVNMNTSSLGVDLVSGVLGSAPVSMFMYFRSQIQI